MVTDHTDDNSTLVWQDILPGLMSTQIYVTNAVKPDKFECQHEYILIVQLHLVSCRDEILGGVHALKMGL